MVLSFYVLCYSTNRIYTQTFDTEESLTRFFGLLTAITSTIALFLQLFVTNRAIAHFGVRTINLLFPWTTVACLTVLTFSFSLPSAILGSLNKDTLMQAFRNPVRSMFFNVLPGYMQGRARAMSIALVMPLALMLCGVLLILLQHLDHPVYYLVPGVFAACLYLFSCRLMNKAYVSTLISTLKECLYLPEKRMYADLQGCGEDTLDEIMRGIKHPDVEVALAFAKILAASFPDQAVEIILRMLVERGCRLTVVPATMPASEVLAMQPDGVFLSNGPGDPEPCDYAIKAIRELLGSGLPIFGICLGHQLLSLASGARTIKMKFGHHGANHPVQDLAGKQVMITSQNHGFAVDDDSLPDNLVATHRSLFDGSLQGVARTDCPAFSFQGHPEASPGPHDVAPLFDQFIDMIRARAV